MYEDARSEKVYTYLLTPWSRVLLEKLTVNFAASQEVSRIYGTRKFLTVAIYIIKNKNQKTKQKTVLFWNGQYLLKRWEKHQNKRNYVPEKSNL
jgi:hypothetical protein